MKIEEIEEYLFKVHNHHPDDGEVIYYAKDILPLIDQLKQKWIPVSERLPDKCMKCLVFTITESIIIENFYHDEENLGQWGRMTNDAVLFWMPLPENPEL